MDRRTFLKTTGSAAAATAAGASGASAVETPAPACGSNVRELRMATAWPDGVAGHADQAFRLARRIETALGGRYRITIEAGAAFERHDCELVHASAHRHVARHSAFAYFAGLPIASGLQPHELTSWLQTGGQELWDELAAEHVGEKLLLAGHSGRASWLWARNPVTTTEDLVGTRVAGHCLAGEIARGLGAEPVELAPMQLAPALAAGRIAGAEWCGLMAGSALGLDRAARILNRVSFNPNGLALALSVRRDVWDLMPTGDRTVLEAVAAAEHAESLAEAEATDVYLIDALVATGRVTIAEPSADLAGAIATLADAIVADVASRDRSSARINASYMAFARANRAGSWRAQAAGV